MKMKNLMAPIITSMEKAMTQRGVDGKWRSRILEEIIEIVPVSCGVRPFSPDIGKEDRH